MLDASVNQARIIPDLIALKPRRGPLEILACDTDAVCCAHTEKENAREGMRLCGLPEWLDGLKCASRAQKVADHRLGAVDPHVAARNRCPDCPELRQVTRLRANSAFVSGMLSGSA